MPELARRTLGGTPVIGGRSETVRQRKQDILEGKSLNVCAKSRGIG